MALSWPAKVSCPKLRADAKRRSRQSPSHCTNARCNFASCPPRCSRLTRLAIETIKLSASSLPAKRPKTERPRACDRAIASETSGNDSSRFCLPPKRRRRRQSSLPCEREQEVQAVGLPQKVRLITPLRVLDCERSEHDCTFYCERASYAQSCTQILVSQVTVVGWRHIDLQESLVKNRRYVERRTSMGRHSFVRTLLLSIIYSSILIVTGNSGAWCNTS